MNFKWIVWASIVAASSIFMNDAQAQTWQLLNQSYAFKSGESVEVGKLYWVVNCVSQLTSPPEVAILDGPPGMTAFVTEEMVMARFQGCPKPVKGAMLKLSAGKIEDYSQSVMTLRIKFHTKDGERQESRSFNVTLFP